MWYTTKTGFLRAGLSASLSPSTLPQLEQSLWSPAASAYTLHLAGLTTSAELASKDIFPKVSLCGAQEPTYLGANSTLKHWNLVSHGQAIFWQNVALSPNLLSFETFFHWHYYWREKRGDGKELGATRSYRFEYRAVVLVRAVHIFLFLWKIPVEFSFCRGCRTSTFPVKQDRQMAFLAWLTFTIILLI